MDSRPTDARMNFFLNYGMGYLQFLNTLSPIEGVQKFLLEKIIFFVIIIVIS